MPTPTERPASSPYIQKENDATGSKLTPTTKAYKNECFLAGHAGRLIRIMCEFEEPKERLHRNYIRSTILFFGSARSMTQAQFDETMKGLGARLAASTDEAEKEKLTKEMGRLKKTEWMCKWVGIVETLATKVAEFAAHDQELINKSFSHIPDYFQLHEDESLTDVRRRCNDLVVTTGGGPGFMEAANRGAAKVDGVPTIGMGISLPFEKGLNPYVDQDLAFEFHYFFTRKFWMMYSCRAIVVAPGGFGTLDELFELLTLRQTKKIPNLPVVLLCRAFWDSVVNWQALADFGVISQQEIDEILFTDEPDEAMAYIKSFYEKLATAAAHH